MANWSVYCEFRGYPLEVEFSSDDDLTDEEMWDIVSDEILMTLEVTKEDE